jgi:hypothetical protein
MDGWGTDLTTRTGLCLTRQRDIIAVAAGTSNLTLEKQLQVEKKKMQAADSSSTGQFLSDRARSKVTAEVPRKTQFLSVGSRQLDDAVRPLVRSTKTKAGRASEREFGMAGSSRSYGVTVASHGQNNSAWIATCLRVLFPKEKAETLVSHSHASHVA